MRSVEVIEPGRVDVVSVPAPVGTPTVGAVRVRMLAVGICGTDLALASGHRRAPSYPWRLGHEGLGIVTETGAGTDGWRPGDVVVLEPNITCGSCEFCTAGLTSGCVRRSSSGVLTQPGFLTECIDHPAEFCHRAPADLPVERLVCAEPLAVASAAVRRAQLHGDETVLVLGAGPQGLLAIQVLLARGFHPLVIEPVDSRRDLAIEFGAQVFDPEASVPDHVIDATGVPEALTSVLEHLAPFSVITVVGESRRHLGLSSFDIVQKELRIQGSFIYEHPTDMESAIELLSEIDTGRLLGPAADLDDAPDLLLAATPGDAKGWVDLR